MDTIKGLIAGLVVVLVMTGLVIGLTIATYNPVTDNIETTNNVLAPDIDLIDQKRAIPETWEFKMSDGDTMKLSEYSGYYLIVDLMSTNCPACETENTELQEIYDDHGDNIKIVSLSVDLSSTADSMATYKADKGLAWDHGLDGGYFTQYFQLRYTPTLVIIDPDGYFRMYHEGVWTSAEIVEAISLM